MRNAPYRWQRLLDLGVVALVAAPGTIIGVVCAIAIRVTSRGPILFRQVRVGRHGQPFEVLKFRTMLDGDNPVVPDASRITRVGAVLRRTSLDELPQLVNVVRGDMSVVGPRPTLAYQVERYTERQRARLDVRPGLTGLAQVNGRNALSWDERIELDLDYVDTQSLRQDLGILARTLGVVISGDGVDGHADNDPLSAVSAAAHPDA